MKFLKRSFLLISASLLVTGCACQGHRNKSTPGENETSINTPSSKNTGKSSSSNKKSSSSDDGPNIDPSTAETYNITGHIKIESKAMYTLFLPDSYYPMVNAEVTPGTYTLTTEFDLEGTIKWDSWGNFSGVMSFKSGTLTIASSPAIVSYEIDKPDSDVNEAYRTELAYFGFESTFPTRGINNFGYSGMLSSSYTYVAFNDTDYFMNYYLQDLEVPGYLGKVENGVVSQQTFNTGYSSVFRVPFIIDIFELKTGEQSKTYEPNFVNAVDIFVPSSYTDVVQFSDVSSGVITQTLNISK